MQICQKHTKCYALTTVHFFLNPLTQKSVLVPEKCSGSSKRAIIFQTDKEKSDVSWFLRFFVENLWCNFLGRPDFIAYKLTDLPKLTVTLLRIFSRTTIAVWTLRTKDAIHEGKQELRYSDF